MKKAREFQKKTATFTSLTTKAFDFMDYNELWEILKQMGVSQTNLPVS